MRNSNSIPILLTGTANNETGSKIWLLKEFMESEHEVAEATAKLDSYTSNKNKNPSCE